MLLVASSYLKHRECRHPQYLASTFLPLLPRLIHTTASLSHHFHVVLSTLLRELPYPLNDTHNLDWFPDDNLVLCANNVMMPPFARALATEFLTIEPTHKVQALYEKTPN